MGSIILFKKFDPIAFIGGKSATCRKLGWNQAVEGSKDCQLRVNFDLPPFAWADVSLKMTVDLEAIPSSWITWLGCDSLKEYYAKYGKSETNEREFLKFDNIRFNPDFDWVKFGLSAKGIKKMFVNYTIKEETAEKLQNVGKSSKYYLSKADEEKGFYTSIRVANGDKINVPFKAMFFEETNKKLGKIISISGDSATDCISHKMGFCQLPDEVKCYGKASECQYCRKDIINCEEANKISGLILLNADEYKLAQYIARRFKGRLIRFNKHGDFMNSKQLLKFLGTADWLKNHYPEANIKWYGYTARDDLMDSFLLDSEYWAWREDIILNGSNKMYTNRFKGVWEHSGDNPKCIGDCRNCGNCYTLKGKVIEVKFHGNINSH